MQQWQENNHLDSQSICLLDVLREPLEAFNISHLADNAAHKHFKRVDIGVGQINPSVASGEVGQAHMVAELILQGSVRHVNLVSQDKERDSCQRLIRE